MLRESLSACSFSCLLSRASVSAQESYYKNKTVTALVGAPPGSGFDTMTRMVAPLGRHIPGNPIVVVQNDGAGTLIAANHLYNRANRMGSRSAFGSAV